MVGSKNRKVGGERNNQRIQTDSGLLIKKFFINSYQNRRRILESNEKAGDTDKKKKKG